MLHTDMQCSFCQVALVRWLHFVQHRANLSFVALSRPDFVRTLMPYWAELARPCALLLHHEPSRATGTNTRASTLAPNAGVAGSGCTDMAGVSHTLRKPAAATYTETDRPDFCQGQPTALRRCIL